MENDSSHEFFARSPQNLTVLAPFMVLKQSNFGENVQKTRETSHFPLNSVYNTPHFRASPFQSSPPGQSFRSLRLLQSGLSGPGLRPGREM